MIQPVDILKKYWGYSAFRPLQEDIVKAVLEQKDVLALLPTGGGKSICFQVPAMAMDGLCLVISPLIALMKDQVNQLQKRGIAAEALHAGQSKREIDYLLDNAANSDLKFLYCSPERLKTELFIERIKKVVAKRGVCLIAVDEAHCISQWGYDFRPAYLEIADLRDLLPQPPIIALTATATPLVREDIEARLKLRNPQRFVKSFSRPNLSYSVRFEEHKERKLLEVLQRVSGSAVVYVSTRKHAREVAQWLSQHHISADYYHAGLTFQERSAKQEDWVHNRTRVIVSTNACGMGIDKPDVRVVVHLDLPDNLEAYYQEAGRAGRDEKKAFALIICNQADIEHLRRKTEQALPELDTLKEVYQMLGNFFQLAVGSWPDESFDFDFDLFSKRFQRHPLEVYHALKVLGEHGVIHLSESFFSPGKVRFAIDQRKMYEFQIANAQFDALIKALLRLHGGELYQNFVTLQENNLSALLGQSVADIRKSLSHLQQRGVVEYSEQKERPQLTFLMPRQPTDKLPIDQKALKAKRKLKMGKMESVVAYVHNREECRTRQLLVYFGETDYGRCEVCDNCIDRHKHEQDHKEKATYRKAIDELLAASTGYSEEQLIKKIKPRNKELLLELLAELIDHGDLHYDSYGYIKPSRSH